jgi:quercetin dioxygenase-like cupin family protein
VYFLEGSASLGVAQFWRKELLEMDIRSIEGTAPEIEHAGSVAVWWLFKPREMFEETDGGYLELVSEFEVKGGKKVNPHQHPTYEFYYVTHGRGIMQIGDETAEVCPGDLIKIPPNTVHSMWPISENASIHCFCFAVGLKGAGPINYTAH